MAHRVQCRRGYLAYVSPASKALRPAEVFIRLKKKDEAWRIFSLAAGQLRWRGRLGHAKNPDVFASLEPRLVHGRGYTPDW